MLDKSIVFGTGMLATVKRIKLQSLLVVIPLIILYFVIHIWFEYYLTKNLNIKQCANNKKLTALYRILTHINNPNVT